MAEVVKGLRDTLKKLEAFEDKLGQDVDFIVRETAQDIEGRAKQNVSQVATDIGGLGSSIYTWKSDERTYTVSVAAPYAPYVEFGTGPQVSVPAELQSQASSFRGRGKGKFKEGLDNIRNWCRRNGIEENLAYPIFMSILKKGLRPRPFLYPAFLSLRQELLKDLEALLERETKKI